jgi:hypothetical protein
MQYSRHALNVPLLRACLFHKVTAHPAFFVPVAPDVLHEALPHFGLRVTPQNTKIQCWKRGLKLWDMKQSFQK